MGRGRIHSFISCGFIAAVGILISACAERDPLSTLPQGENGRVVRIIDGDALVLDTGLTVRLVGVEAPAPARRNREGQPYAEESARLLEDLSLGRRVKLIYPGITRDRYDRALAYVVTDDALGPKLWLNMEILRRGGARARFYPDTSALGQHLLAAEQQARATEEGLWALSAYDIAPAAAFRDAAQGFHIMTGRLASPQPSSTSRAVCSRQLSGTSIFADIQAGAERYCRHQDSEPLVQLRGYFKDGRIEITHTLNLQFVGAPDERAAEFKIE